MWGRSGRSDDDGVLTDGAAEFDELLQNPLTKIAHGSVVSSELRRRLALLCLEASAVYGAPRESARTAFVTMWLCLDCAGSEFERETLLWCLAWSWELWDRCADPFAFFWAFSVWARLWLSLE